MKDKCLKNKEKTANGSAVIFKTLCAAVSMVFLLILDKPYKINYGLFWVLFLNIYLLICPARTFAASAIAASIPAGFLPPA